MTENLKRVIASTFTVSEIEDCVVMNSFVYPTDATGKVIDTPEQEHVQWLISRESMENLYLVLQKSLCKVR